MPSARKAFRAAAASARQTSSAVLPAAAIPTAEPALLQPTEAQIRRRAHEIYLARAGTPGTPEGDWLQAEQEVRGRLVLLGRV